MPYAKQRGRIDGPAEEFTAHLEDNEPGKVVGNARSRTDCPIARFLREKHGLKVAVEPRLVLIAGRTLPTERWMKVFMEHVDRFEGQDGITAREALDALDAALTTPTTRRGMTITTHRQPPGCVEKAKKPGQAHERPHPPRLPCSPSAKDRENTARSVVDAAEQDGGSLPEYCNAPSAGVEGEDQGPYILGWYGDDVAGLGSIFLQRVEFPMEVYAECAGRVVTLPHRASLERWANKEFEQHEFGLL